MAHHLEFDAGNDAIVATRDDMLVWILPSAGPNGSPDPVMLNRVHPDGTEYGYHELNALELDAINLEIPNPEETQVGT